MPNPQPPFADSPEFWAYNEVPISGNQLAYVLVHRDAWRAAGNAQKQRDRYTADLVKSYARMALAGRGNGNWCLRFEPGNAAPTIWSCEKQCPA